MNTLHRLLHREALALDVDSARRITVASLHPLGNCLSMTLSHALGHVVGGTQHKVHHVAIANTTGSMHYMAPSIETSHEILILHENINL